MRCLTFDGISWHFCTKVVSLESLFNQNCTVITVSVKEIWEKLMMKTISPSSPFFLHQFSICKWFPLRRFSKGPKLFGQVGWWETLGVDPWETRQPASDRADRCRRNIQETPGNDDDRYFLRLGSKPCAGLYAWKSISLYLYMRGQARSTSREWYIWYRPFWWGFWLPINGFSDIVIGIHILYRTYRHQGWIWVCFFDSVL